MKVCLQCVAGPHKDQNFPLHLKSVRYYVCNIIRRKYTPSLEGQQMLMWLRRELVFQRIVKCLPTMEEYDFGAWITFSSSYEQVNSNIKIQTV